MPVIPTQTSRVAMEPYQAQRVYFDDSVGQAMQNLGSAISHAGSAIGGALQQKEKQRAGLEAASGLQTLNEDLSNDLTNAQNNAQADGTGLHENFTNQSLMPKTEAFLNGIKDPQLREEYRLRLAPVVEKYKNDSAQAEFKMGNDYSLNKLGDLKTERSAGIAMDPTKFEGFVSDYEHEIDNAPNLTPTQRDELKRQWRQSAPAILAETLKQNDPQTLYFATGHGTAAERRAYVSKAVVAAVAQQETHGGLDQRLSPKGAAGVMQVIPDTGTEIAKEIHDVNFPVNGTKQQKQDYLSLESVSYRYGEYYLNKMLAQNNNNLTLALIAYNAGQQRADEYVAKGGDWSKMGAWSKETQPYVEAVTQMLGTKRFATSIGMPREARSQELGTGKTIPIQFGTQPGRQPVDTNVADLNPSLVQKWQLVQGAFGRPVPVVSGFRDPKTNAAAGGASGSQHLDGNAIDVDVSKLDKNERIKLIELASAAGMTGIGVYNKSLHFDVRDARTAWGPSHHFDSLPGWARMVIAKHLKGGFGSGADTTGMTNMGGSALQNGPGGQGRVAASRSLVPDRALGMIEPGTIQGSPAGSSAYKVDSHWALLPPGAGNGSPVEQYRKTGQHYGIFESQNAAEASLASSPTSAQQGPDVSSLRIANPDRTTWDKRPDGTTKGDGWLGVLRAPNGAEVSEFSISMSDVIGGKDFPTLVPTLTRSEVDEVLKKAADPKGRPPLSASIKQKAADWARKRVAEGKSPFAGAGEGGDAAAGGQAAAQEVPFVFDGFRNMTPAQFLQTRQDGLSAVKKSDDAEKMAKELAKAEANDQAKQDIASLRQSGKPGIAPDQMEAFQEKLLMNDGPAAVLQWARDRDRAQRVYAMTEGIHGLSSSQLTQLLDQAKPSGGPNAAEDQLVFNDVKDAVDAEQKARREDPGSAVQDNPGVKALAQKVDWNDTNSVEDYLSAVFKTQDALGMERAGLPKAKAEKLGNNLATLIRLNPDQDPGEITKGVLNDFYNKFGFGADEIFMQVMETMLDTQVSKQTKQLMSASMLEWMKQTPGLNDPNYRRLSLKYNWNYVPELAAQDKATQSLGDVNNSLTFTNPVTDAGGRAGTAVREWLLNAPSAPVAPAPPGSIPPQGALGPGTGGRPMPMTRIKGVPDAALDQLYTNPQDPTVQSAFRKQFGGDQLDQAMKLLKQQQGGK